VVGPIGGGEVTPEVAAPQLSSQSGMFQEMTSRDFQQARILQPVSCAGCSGRHHSYSARPGKLSIYCLQPAAMKSCVQLEIGLEPRRIRPGIVEPPAKRELSLCRPPRLLERASSGAEGARGTEESICPTRLSRSLEQDRSEKRLKQLSAKLGLQDSVRWRGWIPHEEMWAQYCRYTAFVFPKPA
jgi:hypothetical protein